ncbi:formate dehydrogenase [Streptomyces sp. CS227]|nr:formate dehydrogenase [Streptomyces sp. CS227]
MRPAAFTTPHVSGITLIAHARYAAGTREILEGWLKGAPISEEHLIVDGGRLAGTGAASYTAGEKAEEKD